MEFDLKISHKYSQRYAYTHIYVTFKRKTNEPEILISIHVPNSLFPYSQFPIPYTLYLIPYTLYLYTLYLIPYTQYPSIYAI